LIKALPESDQNISQREAATRETIAAIMAHVAPGK